MCSITYSDARPRAIHSIMSTLCTWCLRIAHGISLVSCVIAYDSSAASAGVGMNRSFGCGGCFYQYLLFSSFIFASIPPVQSRTEQIIQMEESMVSVTYI